MIRKVSFTGSIPVGKALMKLAAERMQRTTMELGGHAPVLVFDDVDVNKVLDLSVAAKYRNAGQVCRYRRPAFMSRKRYTTNLSRASRRALWLCRSATGWTKKTEWGRSFTRGEWLRLMPWSRTLDPPEQKSRPAAGACAALGYFYSPTVISDVPDKARIMSEEPFGPVAVINPFSNFDAVIREANKLPFGLAAFAFTSSARTVKLVGEQLEAGMVGLNTYAISVPESPFGGVKESGHGSEEGIEGLEACLVTKFISEA